MRMYPSRTLCQALTLISLWAACSGCVKRMSAANEPLPAERSSYATIQSVQVSQDASQVELKSDRPLTYTSYKLDAPPKVIVDLSQTEPGAAATAQEINAGNIKRIDLMRQPVGGGVLTRMEIALRSDAEFEVNTDPQDKGKLIVKLAPAAAVAPQPQAEVKQEAPPADAKGEANAEHPVLAASATPSAAAAEPKVEERRVTEEPVPAAKEAPAPAAVAQAAAPDGAAGGVAPAPSVQAATSEPAPAEQKSAQAGAPESKAAPAPSAPAGAPQRLLTSVAVSPDGIDLGIAGGIETFSAFKLRAPDRLVLDLFGVKNKVKQSVVPIEAYGIGSARIGITPDKVRVVLDAPEGLAPFEVRPTDNGLRIRFKGKAPAAVAAAPVEKGAPAEPPQPEAKAPAAPAATPASRERIAAPVKTQVEVPATSLKKGKGALEAVDFKVVENRARVLLKLAGDCQAGKPVRTAEGISLVLRNCQVPKKLQRSLDTSGFGSNVLSVVPYQVKAKTGYQARVQVRMSESSPFTTFQEGDTFVLEIEQTKPAAAAKAPVAPVAPRHEKAAPPAAEELAAAPAEQSGVVELPPTVGSTVAQKKVYKGRRVTLEFSDADVRKIFQLIAEVSNLNFLVADDVTGTISIKLVNVPWDQALDVILDNKGLGMQREGNIVQIKPKGRILSQADEETAAKKARERTMELRTAVFDVNYASVSDVMMQFAALKSDRGLITKDERTSKVIVKDIAMAIDEMRNLLKTLDTPEKQVMIEARIVEASSNFTRDLGVQWAIHYKDASASTAGINTLDTGFGGVVSTVLPTLTTGGLATGMSFGKLTSNIQIDMRLSAAATIGQVKIISTPKVVTLNNKAAKISQGQSIPYQTTSAEGTKTEFVEAALTLEVTPHITPDGSVSMKIKASNNSPGSGTPPPINKKEATTELVVANGETTVIGGIYVDSDTDTNTGVPFLSDIPLLGWLFKSNTKSKIKTELLIFITPKLVI
ncbi:type IV pilus secretin PilQ [Geomonas sp. RF6]|uniref:type IV pilus secretin family protein n=1 Tax=Geomonas sp. RF6 TaxID=2897342 RepID=UPI001E59AEBE|nr:type IV pilus secretin family protein [Geomonas sp. RF6]UFS69651.1 type IV pilus secretin PilQ [Geomonas sp. RF6]